MNWTRSKWLKPAAGCGLILLPGALFGLDPTKSVCQFNCKSWTREDGLPANGINAIAQTKDGYLWLGTQKGLVRFDGAEFKTFDPPGALQFRSSVVSSLSATRDGGLWFGLRNSSFGFYHETTGISGPPTQPWVTPTMNVAAVREAGDGSVWIGSDRGAARWVKGDPRQTQYYGDLSTTWTIYEGTRGRVWLGTFDHGLYYWENGTLKAFPDETLVPDSVSALVEDRLGNIWIGTKGTKMGLRCYDAGFRRRDLPPLAAEVKALLMDRSGRLWIGTTGLGLLTFENGGFTHFQRADGLANENVTALFEDREGTLWIGTRNGLTQLTDVKLSVFSATEGILGRGCHAVCNSADGGIWGAMTMGVSYLNGTNIANYSPETGLSYGYTKLVLEARDGDVYLINGNKDIEVLSQGSVIARYGSTNWPTALAEDDRSVLVAVADGLYRVTRTAQTPYEFPGGQNPPLYWIRNLSAGRDGSILIASVNGLFRLRPNAIDHWSVAEGLPDNDVLWAREDSDGTLWAGLTTGIARIRGREIRCLTMTNGLHDNFTYAMVPDDYGSFWLNSTRGIFRVSRQDLEAVADRRTRHIECTAYDSLEAVKAVDTTEVEYSGCKTPDGRIWFPSPQGVVMINPTNLFHNPTPPPVHIQQVRANGAELKGPQRSPLRPGPGNLEFRYTAATFIAPRKVRFRYRLDGYEAEWVEAGTRRSAFYTNLKPGKYRFDVQACNADGIWNATGDSFPIQLPPHFYQTAWFKGLCGLMSIAALFGLYGWRVRHLQLKHRKLEAANELLESKVRERTRELLEVSRKAGMAEVASSVLHNVGNVLNSVNVSATLVQDKFRKSAAANLTKVLELLHEHDKDLGTFFARNEKGRQLIDYLDALNRHLDTEKAEGLNELNGLVRNVEHIKEIVAMQETYARVTGVTERVSVSQLVEDALRLHAPSYERQEIDVVREFSTTPLILVDRHKVVQILVHLLQNALQAVDAVEPGRRRVIVRIRATDAGHIRIEVADNGVGIPPENLTRIFAHGFTTRKNRHGFGLHSGALAAKELGGTLTAESDGPGKGATFILELPAEYKAAAAESGDAPRPGRAGEALRV